MRAGVFLCQCGGNISGVLDLDDLAAHARAIEGVTSVAVNQFMCGTEGHQLISKAVEERGLDHLVIASCSPRFQGPTFERIARDLRLGENAVAFANLREGCSFIHKDEPERAQAKARKILEGAVARARHQHDLPRQRTFLHRSALVVGGGIAGMTAAEELAGSGIEVHLVERQPSLGGYMARLSKTFPTEDCAMCSLAPRLTSTALESRVHVHTLTEVEHISGPPGEFRVTLRHKPRYVSEACVGCGECVAVCPVEYANDFDFGVSRRRAIDRQFANAVPGTFAVEKKGWSPCKSACAVHTSAQGYVALVAAGRFEEAYRVASEPNPFSSVCGRICTHLCETACARGKVDEPVAIAGIKRFVADTVGPTLAVQAAPVIHDEPVAIVGAGPAGITCARDLATIGYKVTRLRGAARGRRHAAPGHPRLPSAARGHPARDRPGARARHRASCSVSARAWTSRWTACFAQGYKAVYLATGLQQSAPAPLPGDDLSGVTAAVELLRELNLERHAQRRSQGRGRSAAATWRWTPRAASSACSSRPADEPDVTLVYRRTRVEMPANASEVDEAREEGLKVEFLVQPLAIAGAHGAATSIKLQRCELGEPDGSGRRQPVAVEGSEFELEADTIVFAVGQALVDDFAQGCDGLALENGQIWIDRDTMMTARDGVFAGGDAAAAGPLHRHRGGGGRPPRRGRHPRLPARRAAAAGVGRRARRSPAPATRSSPPSPSASACP